MDKESLEKNIISNMPKDELSFDFDETDWKEDSEESYGIFLAIVPYADMMTLLLVFFIFFFMLKDVELGWKILAEKNKSQKEVRETETVVEKTVLDSLRKLNERVITIPGYVLFDSGKADLKWDAQTFLAKIAEHIKKIIKNDPNWQIRIEGHTDDVPIHNSKYPSNWELSTARALSIVKFFIRNNYFKPDQMQIMGYGEFKPKVPNDSPLHRQMNRRVEIILYKNYLKLNERSDKKNGGK